jgi:hypothetical protein
MGVSSIEENLPIILKALVEKPRDSGMGFEPSLEE